MKVQWQLVPVSLSHRNTKLSLSRGSYPEACWGRMAVVHPFFAEKQRGVIFVCYFGQPWLPLSPSVALSKANGILFPVSGYS